MDKYIYNKSNGLWYELQGDYQTLGAGHGSAVRLSIPATGTEVVR